MRITDAMFEGWVGQHHGLLFSIAYWWTGSRSDAEDLTHEAYFQAFRSRETLHEQGSAKAWLVGILRNCYSQMRRKKQTRVEVPLETLKQEEEWGTTTNVTDYVDLHRALQRLGEHYRIPVVLFYFEALSYAEIASALNIPMGTVMSRLARGRKQLSAQLCSAAEVTVVKVR